MTRVRAAARRGAGAVAAAALVALVLASPAPATAAAVPRGAPAWTVGTHFAPSMGEGLDATCPTRLYCYALDLTTSGLVAVRATTDGGATWRTALTAAPGVLLNALACSSRTRCVAIDGEDTLRAFWTDDGGQQWRPTKLPPSISLVTAVTCLQSGDCAAVGDDDQSNPVLAETTDGGASWRVHPIDPAIAASSPFELGSLAVACVTWRDCVVGVRGASGAVYVTRDGGRNWRTVVLQSAFGELVGLSCTRAGHCALAGLTGLDGTVATSGDDGQRWRLTLRTPSAMGFYDVACTLRGACVAAGATRDRSLVVARTSDGAHWHVAPVAAGQLSTIPLVGCGAATCTIVAGLTAGLSLTETSRDLGRTWTTVDPQVLPDEPVAASCPVAGTCELAGYAAGGPFLERTTDDGATFTSQAAPAGVTEVRDVSCATALVCQAIGVATEPLVRFVLLGTTDGGATWTVESTPADVALLSSVVCATATTCVAVGLDKSFNTVALGTADGGSTWTLGVLHGLKEQLAEPTSLTCESATLCVAGLLAIPTPGFLVSTDGGADWTFQPSEPGGASSGIFGPIPITESCTSATSCVAVGESLFGGGLTMLVSDDGGSTWTPEDVLGADLDQVSPLQCRPDGTCLVVAADELTSRSYLLRSPDGGVSWSSSPMPAGWLISVALSCPSDTSCFSVGIEADGGFALAHLG